MHNKVSIIVPIYNVEKYLEKCIYSILNQTYQNIEILLVDDCSTDRSGEIARKIELEDTKCKYIKREKNGGLSAARNTGIENATGEYLAFIDSDDWVSKHFIEHMLNLAQKEDDDIIVCDYIMVTGEKQKTANSLDRITNDSTLNEKIAYIRNHACTKLFKRDFWEKQNLMFPESIKRGEDMAITIPLLTRAEKIGIVNEPLYYYLQRESSLSNNSATKIDFKFYDDAYELMQKNKNDKYTLEIEYHGILEMIYGKTMLMIKHQYTNKEIKKHLEEFKEKFPNWTKNEYIKKMVLLKRIFVKVASYKLIFILRAMVAINEKCK